MNIHQLLADTGLNPFAAKLLAESWDQLSEGTKVAIPYPLVFTIGNCEITLRDSLKNEEGVPVQPTTSPAQNGPSFEDGV
jgi:hypothetical protein